MVLINEIQFVKLDNNEYVMINLINAAADIIDEEIYNKLNDDISNLDNEILQKMIERKYIFQSDKEYKDYLIELNNRINEAEKKSPPCFLLIPTYSCNLQCVYCYERTYDIEHVKVVDTKKLVDIQFEKINDIVEKYKNKLGVEYNPKDIRITIMGCEPLLKVNKEVVRYIIKKAKDMSYTIDAVTNGVELDEFRGKE